MKKIFLLIIFISNMFAVNILILNSYSPILDWTAIQTHTLIHKIQKNIKNNNLFIEYMNTKKFPPTKQRNKNYLNYLNNKYQNMKFDIVIVTDDNALNFIRFYKNKKLFKSSKVFFEGINNLSLSTKLDKNIYAGIFEKKNPLSNFQIAKKIKPHLKVIYVISDHSTSGNKTIKQYANDFKKIKGVNFVYINLSNLERIIDILKNYNKDSVMMLLTFGSMKYHGKVVDIMEVPKIISKHYNNPILVHNDIYTNIPNTNIVGGDCTDAKQQATLNINKVIAYLNGTPMNKIGFDLENTNKIYLNVKNLAKFGVDAYSLGIKNPIFVNKQTSIYELYKVEIISTIVVFLIIVMFLIILTAKNREINKLNKNLEIKIQKAIQENRKKEQLLFQQSKLAAMGEMIGAIAHQWRQPLNSLAINIQLLADDYFDGIVDDKYIENFEKRQLNTISFMSKTIDDFRNFFNRDKEIIEFPLLEAILDVLKLIDKQLVSHNIKIEIHGDDSKIQGYQNEFKQVILNIVNNSKDAIVENKISNGKIKFDVKDNIVTIEDNGGGIPDNIKDRIFEPYFTTKDTKGTGIGLYMSKIIIEEHMNGKLYFKNVENGAQFIIDFKG